MREKIVRVSLFLLIVVQRRCIGNEASFQLVLSYSGWPSSVQATSMLPDMGERAFRASTALPLFLSPSLSLPFSVSLSVSLCLSLCLSRASSSTCEDVCALAGPGRGWSLLRDTGAPVRPLPATYSRFFTLGIGIGFSRIILKAFKLLSKRLIGYCN